MTVTIQSIDRTANGEVEKRTYRGVNPGYAPGSQDPLPLPAEYGSYFILADAVMRGMESLSVDTYVNSNLTIVYDVSEEVDE